MIPSQDSPRQPLATYLRALTGHAGYTIEAAELPVTTGFYTDEIAHRVRAGAHHAALTYLLELLDSPIEHFRSVTPPDSEADERLSYLEHRHAALSVERDRARAVFNDTCKALRNAYAAALLFPHDNAPADHSADLRSGLTGILWRLGLVEAPPSHPATFAVYRAYQGGDTIEVSIDPFAEPGTQINRDRRGAVLWMASFGPYTPAVGDRGHRPRGPTFHIHDLNHRPQPLLRRGYTRWRDNDRAWAGPSTNEHLRVPLGIHVTRPFHRIGRRLPAPTSPSAAWSVAPQRSRWRRDPGCGETRLVTR